MHRSAIIDAVRGVTKKWAKQRKAEERKASRAANRREVLVRSRRVTLKDAAYACMEEAYLKASGGGRLPAHARQIMYQARPSIQAKTGQQLDDQYFCQTLVPDFLVEYEPGWDVVFDDRGHFAEPHTKHVVGLGTLAVRKYLADLMPPAFTDLKIVGPKLATQGPQGCFGAILFIEKEGFTPLFRQVRLAERYDIAIMSTKGVSNTAARTLVDKVCGRYDVPLLVLHDFDKSGFSILGTLRRSTRRYTFRNAINVIDLGLRLTDVEDLGLAAERVFDRGSRSSRAANLRENGATPDEIEFLLDQRVELNALASDELVTLIEGKLAANGIAKVVPERTLLEAAYRHRVAAAFAREQGAKLMDEARQHGAAADVPDDLHDQIARRLEADASLCWIDALARLVAQGASS